MSKSRVNTKRRKRRRAKAQMARKGGGVRAHRKKGGRTGAQAKRRPPKARVTRSLWIPEPGRPLALQHRETIMISRGALYHRVAEHLRNGIGIRLEDRPDGTLVPTVTLPPFHDTRALIEDALAAFVKDFAEQILHGDEVHREWLMQAADAYSRQEPLPPPRQQPAPQVLDESHAALAASRKKVEVLQKQLGTMQLTADRLGNEVDGLRPLVDFGDRLAEKAAMVLAMHPGGHWHAKLRTALDAYQTAVEQAVAREPK